MTAGNRLRGAWLDRPALDLVAVGGPLGLWALAGCPTPDEASRALLFTTVSGAAGVTMAAAAFVCTIFFQSDSPTVQDVRRQYGSTVRANWLWILPALLVAVVLPLAGIVIDPRFPIASTAMAAASVGLLMMSFIRVIYWFNATLLLQDHDRERPVPTRPKNL